MHKGEQHAKSKGRKRPQLVKENSSEGRSYQIAKRAVQINHRNSLAGAEAEQQPS